MTTSRALAAALALALAPATLARAQDTRVASREYVPDQVVSFAARPGFQSTIAFADGERIENIAVGESGAWQVTPNRRANLLFVKPQAATAPVTNMTVVTDRHTYLFELRPAARAIPVYLLRFTYPHDPVAPVNAEGSTELDIPQLLSAVQVQELPVNDLNFAWTVKGSRRLYPERVFDDGESVYLAWAPGRALPAVLAIGPDGKTEGAVNLTTDGDYLVVAGFHSKLILRLGQQIATLATSRTPPAEAHATAQSK